jgi:hypothetical protein
MGVSDAVEEKMSMYAFLMNMSDNEICRHLATLDQLTIVSDDGLVIMVATEDGDTEYNPLAIADIYCHLTDKYMVERTWEPYDCIGRRY